MSMEVGELVGKAGAAAEELGLDLKEIFEDPDKLQVYTRFAIATALSAVVWHRADEIKFKIYCLTAWLKDPKNEGKGFSITWRDFVMMVLSPAISVAWVSDRYNKSVLEVAKQYGSDMTLYQKNHAEYLAKVKLYEDKIAQLRSAPIPNEPLINNMIIELNYWKDKLASMKEPVKPLCMVASTEERIIYVSVVFLLVMHPELIGASINGFGQIIQGIGEIVPL